MPGLSYFIFGVGEDLRLICPGFQGLVWFLWLIPSNMAQRKPGRADTGLRRGWPVDTQRQGGFGRQLPLGEKEEGALQMVVAG